MTLQEFLEENGYETRSYSGRAMFGKTCLAVTVSDPVIAAQNIGYGIGVHAEQVEDEYELHSVKPIRWDQMGHDEMISKGMLETCAVILDEMRDETERARLTRRIKRHWKI